MSYIYIYRAEVIQLSYGQCRISRGTAIRDETTTTATDIASSNNMDGWAGGWMGGRVSEWASERVGE